MATKIVTKNSSTASAVPTASDLVQGELAVNVADKRLFTEDNTGTIVELGTNPSTIDINAGSIDGTAIGASSASTGAFTTLTATGLTVDTNTLYVDSTNNRVGVGTTSPNANLDIESSNATLHLTDSDDSTYAEVRNNGGTLTIGSDVGASAGGSSINFKVDNTERMRIDSSGNLGIGTTSPTEKLHLNGTALMFGARMSSNNGSTYWDVKRDISTGHFHIADDSLGNVLTIRQDSGNVGIGTTSPSVSLQVKSSGELARLETTSSGGNNYLAFYKPSDARQGFIGFGGGSTDNKLYINNDENAEIVFRPNNTERMRIDSSGNVGIGTSSPVARLEVHGAFPYSGTVTSLSTSVTKASARIRGSSDASTSLYFGSLGNDAEQYIQASNDSGTGADDIALNPYGGKVGIGRTPRVALDVAGEVAIPFDTNYGLRFYNQPQNNWSSIGCNETSSAANLVFKDSTGEAMRITSGNLLVGTTATTPTTGGIALYKDSTRGIVRAGTSITSADAVAAWYNPNGKVGQIVTSGSSTSYNTSSDQRLKENIADADDAGSKIDAIQVRKFDWKADGSHQDYGMIAQELVEVAPEAVTVPTDSEEMMGVDYSKLVPMLIKEIQSLRNRVAQLEE